MYQNRYMNFLCNNSVYYLLGIKTLSFYYANYYFLSVPLAC